MRTIFFVPVGAMAVAAALSLSGPGLPAGPAPAGETRLERAARVIADESRTPEVVGAALRDLLDEAIAAAPASGLAGEWTAKAAQARELLAARPPAHDEARRLLAESWREAFGTAWAFPAGVATIDDALAFAKRNVGAAATARREGRSADAVRLLLETVLLVVTPMHAPPARS